MPRTVFQHERPLWKISGTLNGKQVAFMSSYEEESAKKSFKDMFPGAKAIKSEAIRQHVEFTDCATKRQFIKWED